MKAYKLLRRSDDELFSINDNKTLAVRYNKTVPTRPKLPGTQLFVFKEINYAKDFRGSRAWEIWEVEVPRLTKLRRRILRTFLDYNKDDAIKFWAHQKASAISSIDKQQPPMGTYLAPQLKLIRKVE
jgi:hypothetical protein